MSGHVADQLSPFLDDELDARERQAVARHLTTCLECSRHLEELGAVDRLAAVEPVPVPEGFFDDFASRVRSRIREAPAATRSKVAVPGWAMGLAAGLAIALVAPLILRQRPATAPDAALLTRAPATAPAVSQAPIVAPSAVAEDALKGLGYMGPQTAESRDQPKLVGGAAPASPPQAPPQTREPARAPALARKKADLALRATPEPEKLQDTLASAGERQERESDPARDDFEQKGAKRGDAGGLAVDSRDRAVATKEKTEAPGQAAGNAGFATSPAENAAPVPAVVPRIQKKSEPSPAFRALMQRQTATIAEARGLREAWHAFARSVSGAEADEARVREIESGIVAYQLSGEQADLDLARRDAAAYLRRDDAAQKDRIRALLASVH